MCFVESASNCYHVLRNLFESCKKFSGFLENDRFVGENVAGTIFMLARVTSIKQIRVFVGLILQPEMDPPKIVPDPTIKIERDESSQSHHTETTLLPSGIKVFLQQ